MIERTCKCVNGARYRFPAPRRRRCENSLVYMSRPLHARILLTKGRNDRAIYPVLAFPTPRLSRRRDTREKRETLEYSDSYLLNILYRLRLKSKRSCVFDLERIPISITSPIIRRKARDFNLMLPSRYIPRL